MRWLHRVAAMKEAIRTRCCPMMVAEKPVEMAHVLDPAVRRHMRNRRISGRQ